MSFETNAEILLHGGKLLKLSHESNATNTKMDVNVFLPPSSDDHGKVPVLMYLSGLTCTPNNACEKSFLTFYAAKYGFAVVFPDTSPRGANIEGEDESYDFGSGAGFYVDATQAPWLQNYNMFTYVHEELQQELAKKFSQLDFRNISITGHSMGGFGALSGFLKNPGKYRSVSAFSAVSNPLAAPWGQKAFGNYLGKDTALWHKYDPTYLIRDYTHQNQPDILIHQGAADTFYHKEHQLLPENFVKAAKESAYAGKVDLRVEEGYDHLYYFISTFMEEHAKHHAKYLGL